MINYSIVLKRRINIKSDKNPLHRWLSREKVREVLDNTQSNILANVCARTKGNPFMIAF